MDDQDLLKREVLIEQRDMARAMHTQLERKYEALQDQHFDLIVAHSELSTKYEALKSDYDELYADLAAKGITL